MSMLMLFFVFFYVGLFAIGGGLVAASFMRQALVEQYGLITDEKFYSMLAISESTPGPLGINIATYIGTELHGIPGGIIATFGEVLPSIIIIILIARFFSKFQEKPLVKSIFSAKENPHYASLPCCGVCPVCFLQYRQKKLTSVKWYSHANCLMLKLVRLSCIFSCRMVYWSMMALGVCSVTCFTMLVRYFGVMFIFSA